MKIRLLIPCIAFLLASCAAQYDYVPVSSSDYYDGEDSTFDDNFSDLRGFRDTIETNRFSFVLTYLGMGSAYYIFECSFVNLSNDTLLVKSPDFVMDVDPGRVVKPWGVNELTYDLRREKQELKKQKKSRTIWGAVLTGLEFVAAASSGSPLGENLLFTAEPVAYIFEERSFYQRNIESVEDEIIYIHEMALEAEWLAPGEILTTDLLFPLQVITSDVRVIYTDERIEYPSYFNRGIFRNR